MKTVQPEFEWNIAISFMDADKEFAKSLKKELAKEIDKVFIYTEHQLDILNKSGAEFYTQLFKSQSKFIVMLHRNGYGEIGTTAYESEAIHYTMKYRGKKYILPIKMDETKPEWWVDPLYLDSRKQKVKEIATAILHTISNHNEDVIPLTAKQKAEQFAIRKQLNNKIFEYLNSEFQMAKESTISEANNLRNKITNELKPIKDTLELSLLDSGDFTSQNKFSSYLKYTDNKFCFIIFIDGNKDLQYWKRNLLYVYMGKNVDFQNNIHIRQIKQICKPKDIYHIIFDENNNFGWSKLVGNPLDLITSEELAIQLVNKYTELIIEDKPINIAPKIRITFPNNSRNSY